MTRTEHDLSRAVAVLRGMAPDIYARAFGVVTAERHDLDRDQLRHIATVADRKVMNG